jgi:hypothetical protein
LPRGRWLKCYLPAPAARSLHAYPRLSAADDRVNRQCVRIDHLIERGQHRQAEAAYRTLVERAMRAIRKSIVLQAPVER